MTRPAGRLRISALLAALALLAGCTTRVEEPKPAPQSDARPSASATQAAQDRADAVRIMRERATALRSGDEKAFLATISPTDPAFVKKQTQYFDNLAKLPVTHLSMRVGDQDKMMQITAEGDYQLPVDFTMQLQGYDIRPVTIPLVYTYTRRAGSLLLSNDRNPQNDVRWRPAPWDVTAIDVRRTPHLLGIFDSKTVVDADAVMSDLQDAMDAIDPLVPPWRQRVVVYDISDLDGLDKMSLMQVNNTAGVEFDVNSKAGGGRFAGSRIAVNPSATDATSRAHVLRHEMVHASLGALDESSPTWLVEGTAEALARTVFTTESLQAQARSVLSGTKARPLASGRDFYQVRPTQNYELGSLVCTYLIDTRGREMLWTLMRAFVQAVKHHDIVAAGDIDTVTKRVLGLTTKELATAALDWASVPHS
jgi:hypothetical protein